MSDPPVKEGDVLAGKYQVERILGSGGMGIVVAAWHRELEQRVAVKFLLPEIAERSDAAERFRREARAAVKIRSEHVARILDVGTMDGVAPYMVMEYLDGHDLAEELRKRRTLPIAESLEYVLQASEAVAEAHAAGIVHRDLKPANLFLTKRSDGARVIKVLDFGISKSVVNGSVNDLSLTRTSSLIGSPLYMSPEQMKSARDVDARTDIWAIGAILFEMLAGRPPYMAESVPQLCAALLHEAPPPLGEFRKDVPPALEAIILRCLAKDRGQRWSSIAEFAQNVAMFAPASARIHADRARRVLGSTEISFNDLSGSGSHALGGGTQIGMPASVERSTGSGRTPMPARQGSTLASWGVTGDSPESKQRRRRLVFGVLAFGLLGAAAVIAVLKTRSPEQPAAPIAAGVELTAPPQGAATQAAAAAQPPPVAATASTPAPAVMPVASASADVVPAPKGALPPVLRRVDGVKPRNDRAQGRPAPNAISDFGGRR